MSKKNKASSINKKTTSKKVVKKTASKKPVKKVNKPVAKASAKKKAPVKKLVLKKAKPIKVVKKAIVAKKPIKKAVVKKAVAKTKKTTKPAPKKIVKAPAKPIVKAKKIAQKPIAKSTKTEKKVNTPTPKTKVATKVVVKPLKVEKVKVEKPVKVKAEKAPKLVVKKQIVAPTTFRVEETVTNGKAIKEPAGKFEMEFVIRASEDMVYEFVSTESGLSEWFCDDVNIRNGIFTFEWDGQSQQAKLVKEQPPIYIRYQWLDKNDGSYFEFRTQKDELTNDISLIITDFASDKDDEVSARLLWHSQVDKLLHVLGSYF